MNTARPKAVVNAVKGNNLNAVKASSCWAWKPKHKIQVSGGLSPQNKLIFIPNVQGNPQMDLQDQEVIDSGCSRHMTGNVSYLTDYEEIDGGYVAFGGNPKGGKIIGKCTIKTGKAVNTACYGKNRVLVVKPHNKTPYEFFHGRTPTLSFMRPFGCPVTILNTIDHLGKFDGKAYEEVQSYSCKVAEPDWLFDIDALTRTMDYEPIVVGTQYNGFACTKANDNAGQAKKETEPVKDYIFLPLWTAEPPYSQDPNSSHDDGSKPSSNDEKKVDEDPRKESECNDHEKEDNVNSTNNVNTAGTNEVNAVGGKTIIELSFDLNMHALEDYSIFDFLRCKTPYLRGPSLLGDMERDDGDKKARTSLGLVRFPTTRFRKSKPWCQRLNYEDTRSSRNALLELAFRFEDSCAVRDDLRKAYEKCNDMSQESRALIGLSSKEITTK
ncbi:ribonuclease H-like domain-containing protein [Tanacetum coccineum]|uniref:Ribonuclease H-like domain-containing protein n=1 Tax=Tanacetum coccineum TaxID=301880 RepID=A0ABQ5DM67_9ASTR